MIRPKWSIPVWHGWEILSSCFRSIQSDYGRTALQAHHDFGADVLDYISAGKKDPIAVGTLTFDDGGLSETLAGFEGFEAIAFSGRQVFVTIETRGGSPMMGYLACGTFDSDARSIKLDPEKLAPLVPQTSFNNASDEGLCLWGISFYHF
jgi:hypothetical protein